MGDARNDDKLEHGHPRSSQAARSEMSWARTDVSTMGCALALGSEETMSPERMSGHTARRARGCVHTVLG